MSEYTPTTKDVREVWIYAQDITHDEGEDFHGAEFDRWLAAHDAEVRARALVQGFSEGVNFIDDQPGPWGACMVAGRTEAARRRAEVEKVVDL